MSLINSQLQETSLFLELINVSLRYIIQIVQSCASFLFGYQHLLIIQPLHALAVSWKLL